MGLPPRQEDVMGKQTMDTIEQEERLVTDLGEAIQAALEAARTLANVSETHRTSIMAMAAARQLDSARKVVGRI